VAACKAGRKPESAQAKSEVVACFEWARQKRIVIAMSGEVVYTADGEAVAVAEMMRRFPVQERYYR
jgi:hydroxyethylthiazole kinase-like sugar kinase family protein